ETAARVSIQEVVLRHRRRYGYRRVTEDLHRQGMVINHKRVARIMREDNLLAIRYRKYILTTNSQHDCQVYESGGTHDGDRYQPALGGGYHLYPTADRVRVPGGGDRPVLTQGHRLGAGSQPHRQSGGDGATTGHRPASAAARSSPSLRSGHPVCERRIRCGSPNQPNDPK